MPSFEILDEKENLQMSYEVIGVGQPILLIHGWLCNGRFWDDFLYLEDMGYQLIIPDLRGHGNTLPGKKMDIVTLAEDMQLLLDHLKIGKLVVIGHSMGGLVAQALYERIPERIIALGLWNTAAKMPFGYGIGTLGYILRMVFFAIGLIITYPISPLFRVMLGNGWALSFYRKWKSPAYKKLVGYVKATSKKGVIKAALALKGYDGRENLEKIQVPVMLLHGKKDYYITPHQFNDLLREKIPINYPYFVEEAGHFPPNEQPEEVGKYLGEFLDLIKEDWE